MELFRKFIFIVLLGSLFMPFIQSKFHVLKIKPLSGAIQLSGDTNFTFQGWFSGKYQVHKECFLRDTFGLRNLFIRTHNQIDFSLFKKPNAGDIVVGKNNDLFITWYIGSYCGNDFTSSQNINSQLNKLKFIQDKLAEMNKTLLIVFAPSKVSFNPENIPAIYTKSDSTNYAVFVKLIKTKGLNYIDFNASFIRQKNKTTYPLYSKYGTHWSSYGACLAGDSIIHAIEKLRGIKMPVTNWKNNVITEEANDNELELENELNLLFPLKCEIMGHPKISNVSDSTRIKPTAMIVGDSYSWGLLIKYNIYAEFSNLAFFYYYKTIYPAGKSFTIDITKFNLLQEIKRDDVFIIEATAPNLTNLGWGFADSAFDALNKESTYFSGLSIKVSPIKPNTSKFVKND